MSTFVWEGNTSANSNVGSNWLVGGVPQGSPPTAADDVLVGSGTGATNNPITFNAAFACRSLDFNGYTGTATHNALVTITIGDGAAGAGNIALRMSAGMTYTRGSNSTSIINFISTSTTQQTVTTNGKSLGAVVQNGAGSSYLQTDNMLINAIAGTFTHSTGTWDLGVYTMDVGIFTTNGTGTRSILGSVGSIINLNSTASSTYWNATTSTNLTVSSDIRINIPNGASNITQVFNGGTTSIAYGVVDMRNAGANMLSRVRGTCSFVKFYAGSTAGQARTLTFTAGVTYNFTQAPEFSGSSGGILTVASETAATHTLSLGSGVVSSDYLHLTNSIATGGASWYAGANSTNNGGNSGWIFTAPPSSTFKPSVTFM